MPANENEDQVQPRQLVLKGGPQALLPYVGKTVAIVDGEVKLSGTWDEVVRGALEQKLDKPVFMYVPAGRVIGRRTV